MKEKVTIEKVYKRPSRMGSAPTLPTLLKFRNGRMAAISKERTLFTHMMKNKNVEQRMVVASGQVYHGTVNATESSELFDMYICVRNKSTNQMRIVPIDEVHLMNNVYESLAKNLAPPIQTNEDKNRALLKQFGGRIANRNLQKKQQMQMNIDVVKNDLDQTVRETVVAEENVVATNHFDLIRPKFNAEASRLEEVYNLHDIISADLLDRLEEEAMAVYSTDIASIPISSEFLLKAIEKIQKSSVQSAENFLRIKIIIYMDSLLRVIKTRVRSLEKEELSGITTKVEWDVRRKFSDPNGKAKFTRTALSTEKALCYFIVLALLISEKYQVDVGAIAKELGVPGKKIIKYGQIVNARVQSKSNVLALTLPSKVPELKNTNKRKGRL